MIVQSYEITLDAEQFIAMPEGAEILAVLPGLPARVAVDRLGRGVVVLQSAFFLWARVDDQAPMKLRRVEVVGRGMPISTPALPYVGAIQIGSDRTTLHVFA